MNSWKKFILGEKMPDRNDPKYQARHESAMSAGRKFADTVGISKMAGKLQALGEAHKSICVLTVLGIVALLFFIRVYQLVSAYSEYNESCRQTTIEKIDKALKNNQINHETVLEIVQEKGENCCVQQ